MVIASPFPKEQRNLQGFPGGGTVPGTFLRGERGNGCAESLGECCRKRQSSGGMSILLHSIGGKEDSQEAFRIPAIWESACYPKEK